MKKRLSLLVLSLIAGITLGSASLVVAETDSDQNAEVTTQSSTETKDALRQKLEKKKTELNIKLAENEKQRITTRCSSAQGKVKSLSENVSGRVTVRQKAYSKLVEKLEALVPKLQANGVDTTALETQVDTLKQKIAKFDADLSLYQEAIADLKEVDCAADPEAFQAALLAARTARDVLVNDAIDIRSYVNNTIKETIKTIRRQLNAQESTTTQPSSDTTNQNEGTN